MHGQGGAGPGEGEEVHGKAPLHVVGEEERAGGRLQEPLVERGRHAGLFGAALSHCMADPAFRRRFMLIQGVLLILAAGLIATRA